jgi:dihydroorotate dehydrogenase (fumarate)
LGGDQVPRPRTGAELSWKSTMDLSTSYLGLRLEHPIVASSSPLTGELDTLRRLEDAGAAAVVLPSLFEEQIEYEVAASERLTEAPSDSFPEALTYFAPSTGFGAGPHRYLDLISRARTALNIPVIASLNGTTDRGWTNYARLIQQAGASALEINSFFVPVDIELDGHAVEHRHVAVLKAVRSAVSLPVAVKLAPHFSAVGDMVRQLDRAGADGFVLFNRFYEPDIDLTAMRLTRDLDLSTPAEIRLPLLWISVLAGHLRGSLAAATGVESSDQVVKYLLAGADVVTTTSALLRHGANHMRTLVRDLSGWLEARDIASIGDIRGKLSKRCLDDSAELERANYINILTRGHPSRL